MRALALLGLVAACGDGQPSPTVLLFSATAGFRHTDAIDAAKVELPLRLDEEGIRYELSEDAVVLEDLARFDAIFFLYTSGNDLVTPAGRVEIESFVRGGGGFAGVHSATDTEYEWPFYQELVLAPFQSHTPVIPGTVVVEISDHPATRGLPARWSAIDEYYNFQRNPRADDVEVLLVADESTIGGVPGADHPIAWTHERLGGRVFYTALGHPGERWREPEFIDHVVGGLRSILLP